MQHSQEKEMQIKKFKGKRNKCMNVWQMNTIFEVKLSSNDRNLGQQMKEGSDPESNFLELFFFVKVCL